MGIDEDGFAETFVVRQLQRHVPVVPVTGQHGLEKLEIAALVGAEVGFFELGHGLVHHGGPGMQISLQFHPPFGVRNQKVFSGGSLGGPHVGLHLADHLHGL